jgi:hypothetical protein
MSNCSSLPKVKWPGREDGYSPPPSAEVNSKCSNTSTYFAAISLFRSRLLSRATKIILYKTLVRPVVSYGAEEWTLTKKEEQALLIFERKIFRRIYGPKYENGEWKSRTNQQEEMSKEDNIVKWIKGQRISWLGHLQRME